MNDHWSINQTKILIIIIISKMNDMNKFKQF